MIRPRAKSLIAATLSRPFRLGLAIRNAASARRRSRAAIVRLRREIGQFWRQGECRSVVFLHGIYYNFFYMAAALRKRGWNAMLVSVDPPDHPDRMYGHGEDINLFDPDHATYYAKIDHMVDFIRERGRMVHFGQVGRSSFYYEGTDGTYFRERIPWDFLELKRAGVKIGYTHGGCCDLVSQTAFYKWSGGMCDKCAWQNQPQNCSDVRNLAWGHTVQQLCDLICIETDPMLDFKAHHHVYREPLTFALDPEVWNPKLEIPDELRIGREADEVLVLHSVGNAETRWRDGDVNAKGTSAVFRAVANLQAKGLKVRLIFHDKIPNIRLRFIQAQADVIVDQLIYGRYGATARESMMLGKPTVGHINPREVLPGAESQCIIETPIVEATEASIESVLEDLVRSPAKRRAIGEASRRHAIKWWSADSCAERYEGVYDRIMCGELPMERVISPFVRPVERTPLPAEADGSHAPIVRPS
jgi:glycosyltransferase involved in cell wall biosynthesis